MSPVAGGIDSEVDSGTATRGMDTGARLVVLDRDGVINRDSDAFVKTSDEWLPLPGSIEAIAALSKAGFTIAVASNQSGLARGLVDRDALEAMHEKLRQLVGDAGGQVGKIVVCPHAPSAGCDCRKPKPGLLIRLSEYYSRSMQDVPVIGDSLRDLQAATAVAARPILVRTGNGSKTEAALPPELVGIEIYDDLAAAGHALIEE